MSLAHSPYLAMPLRSHDEALSIALKAARDRLPIGEPAERMDGKRAIVRAVSAKGMQILVLVELPDGTLDTQPAGYWFGRAAL